MRLGTPKKRELVGKCKEKADTVQQGNKKRPNQNFWWMLVNQSRNRDVAMG